MRDKGVAPPIPAWVRGAHERVLITGISNDLKGHPGGPYRVRICAQTHALMSCRQDGGDHLITLEPAQARELGLALLAWAEAADARRANPRLPKAQHREIARESLNRLRARLSRSEP